MLEGRSFGCFCLGQELICFFFGLVDYRDFDLIMRVCRFILKEYLERSTPWVMHSLVKDMDERCQFPGSSCG